MTKSYLEPSDVERLEDNAACLRDKLLVRILFRTGCRVSEALALSVDDVDMEKGAVTIQHLKVRVARICSHCDARLAKTHTFCPCCGEKVNTPQVKQEERRRVRTIPLDRDTLEVLKDYIHRGGPVSRNGRQLLFGINRHRAWQVVRDCAERASLEGVVNPETGEIRGVSPHRLRDAFAVMAVQHDDSTDGIRMLQEQLGHASIGTTMRYRKVAGQELKEWYDRLWDGDGSDTSR